MQLIPWNLGYGGPLHLMSTRKPNDETDKHYPVFDSTGGCVAHVSKREDAEFIALAPEVLQALRSAKTIIGSQIEVDPSSLEQINQILEKTKTYKV